MNLKEIASLALAEDAAAKRTVEFHVSRNDDKFIFDPLDFDQNPFEWGAIYHINKIRDAIAQKKDGITEVELKELLKPFYKAAEESAEEYGRNKEWVKKTVLGVPRAFEDAFADITNGEGAMGKQYFLDHLTIEAICALAAGDIDGICEAVDYYDKKGRYNGKDTPYHVGDFVIVPATGGGHEIRRIVAFADDAQKCWLKNVGRGRLRQFECKGLGKRYDTYDSAQAHMETLFPEERQEMILPVTVEDASDSVDMLLTSDLHTTDLDTLDPKDARIVVIAGDIMGGGMDSDDAGREYLEKKFFPWCREHADKDIVVTAGNHDKFLFRQWVKGRKLNWPENVHYLVDKGETIGGLKFYGTPWCLKNRPGRFEGTEETLKEYFAKMPKNLDVLISHSPPYIPGEKIDDRGDGLHEGSKELTEAILDKKPRLVVCGHVHSGSRKPAELGDSKVMNVSRVDHDRSEEAHRPHIIHFHAKKGTD